MNHYQAQIWKPIPGLPMYEASENGRLRSRARSLRVRHGKRTYRKVVSGMELAVTQTVRNGQPHYETVKIHGKTLLVHRLIALAWHYSSYFPGAEVNHKNGDKRDNRAANLEWVTRSENELHSYRVLGRSDGRSIRGVFQKSEIEQQLAG